MALKQALLRSLEHVATPLSYLPDALRLGPGYVATGRAIRSAERDDPQAAEARVLERLRSLLDHAAKHVPFYRDFYRAKGFDPAGLRSLEDWARVPVVTKHDLQAVPLQARSAPGAGGVLTNTGGTSGAPLGFLLAEGWTPFEWAHMHRIWQARGYRTRHLKLRFGGAHFDDDLPLRYHPRHNEYIVNANCPLPQVAQAAIALSSRRAVRWVHGYPSLVAEFAHALDGQPAADAAGFRHRLFGALLGSEFPAPAYREAIARLLTSNIVSWYGHSEMAVLAGETREGVYLSFPTYGYAEAVPSEAGHRLVCTSLHNTVHPFVRYDTGDSIEPVARIGGALAFRITEGRIGDFVRDRHGRRLALTSIVFGRHHAAFDDLLHLQVREDAPGRMTLLVVPRTHGADVALLQQGFDFAGLDLDWRIELIGAPIRTRNGKIRLKVDG
jgi:phenylacetate-CoA ligase